MSEGSRQGSAHQSVTQSFSAEAYRRKRVDDTVSIRKQRREEQHLARRQRTVARAPSPPGASSPAPGGDSSAAASELQPLAATAVPGVDALTDERAVVAALTSPDVDKQLQATTKIRMVLSSSLLALLLFTPVFVCVLICFFFSSFLSSPSPTCQGTEPPIDQVLSLNCLPYLVRFLSSPNIKLQFEAAWALTNSLLSPFFPI